MGTAPIHLLLSFSSNPRGNYFCNLEFKDWQISEFILYVLGLLAFLSYFAKEQVA
jgi:hypothetical protein